MLLLSLLLYPFNWQRYAETSKQRLDIAILIFFQNFKKSYVGDQAIHSSKVSKIENFETNLCQMLGQVCLLTSFLLVFFFFLELFLLQQLYAKLSELLGLHDHMLILNVIVGKIATNLKCYGEVIVIVEQFPCCYSQRYAPVQS